MTSYIQLINKIRDFYDDHLQVYRFGSDFEEQLDNFCSENEKYPLIYVSVLTASTTDYLGSFTLEIKCLDVIEKDRSNINAILNTTHLILSDLYRHLYNGNDLSIYAPNGATYEPMNNAFCDFLAGFRMTIDIEVETQSLCEIPKGIEGEMNPILVGEDEYLIEDDETVIIW
jgi:hypothetical protein